MAKLIHAVNLKLFQDASKGWDDPNNNNYYSIAFTDDGHIVTHGKVFTAPIGSLPIQNITTGTHNINNEDVKTPLSVSNSEGVFTITHDLMSTPATDSYKGGQIDNDKNLSTFGIYVDDFGHTSITNFYNVDIAQVRQKLQKGDTSHYYLLGASQTVKDSDGSGKSFYGSTHFYQDAYVSNGSLYANTFYFKNGGTYQDVATNFLPISEVTNGRTDAYKYRAGTGIQGLVELVNDINHFNNIIDPNNTTVVENPGSAVGVSLLNQVKKDLENRISTLMSSNDAMIFIGTIKENGELISGNGMISNGSIITSGSNFKAGWTFKFNISEEDPIVKFEKWYIEQGDLLICTNDTESWNSDCFDVIQTNIDNPVTSDVKLDGIIYANNSRHLESLSFGDEGQVLKIEKKNGVPTLAWGDSVSTWRPITINDAQLGANIDLELAFTEGLKVTQDNDTKKYTITNTSPLSAAKILNFYTKQSDTSNLLVETFNPNAVNLDLVIGSGLTLTKQTKSEPESESNTIQLDHYKPTSTSTNTKLYKINMDNFGHIANSAEVTSLGIKLDNKLTFSKDDVNYEFNNSKNLTFNLGGNIQVSQSENDPNTITLNSVWRPLQAYTIDANGFTMKSISGELVFGNDFAVVENNGQSELSLVWCEIN